MSTVASCLVILFSHGGHCFGGGPCAVSVTWKAEAQTPPAVVAWSLSYAGTAAASGKMLLESRGAPAQVALELPAVRDRTKFTWTYQLLRKDDGQLIEEGSREIHVYPPIAWTELRSKLDAARVLLLGGSSGLSRLLDNAQLRWQTVATPAELELRSADVILVAPDALARPGEGQAALLAIAARGAGVLVLAQSGLPTLTGLKTASHPPAACQWRADHPLLAALPTPVWQSWLETGATTAAAVTVPPTEPVLEVAYWPPMAESRALAPLDAAIVEKQVGRGRLILCQVPASADLDDPRTQLFLRTALEYLRTDPRPTPARAARLPASKPADQPGSRSENILGVHDD
jgi:hypothetical protein